MSQTPQESAYRVKNWSPYNAALVKRGALTVWVDQEALGAWHSQGPPRWGAQFISSDTAIQGLLTLRVVFHLPRHATQGLAHSIFPFMGLPWDVPPSSTLSRRAATTRIDLPQQGDGPLQLVIDSTGRKRSGEGEWKVRQHGSSKRRTGRKLHLAVDPESHQIQAAMVTEAGVTAAAGFGDRWDQVERPITEAAADGADDQAEVDDALAARGAKALIPPRKDAKIKVHGNTKGAPHPRDQNLRAIRRKGRRGWKRAVGDPMRSLAETALRRIKGIFGDRLWGREWRRQASELGIRCRALNLMTPLGMPVSVKLV
jgi:hypothetical protein